MHLLYAFFYFDLVRTLILPSVSTLFYFFSFFFAKSLQV